MALKRDIIPAVIEQHAEEAAFLWLLRDAATDAPHYDREDLAALEGRIAAHLHGLKVAGDAGLAVARAMLAANAEPGEVFALGVLALESDGPAGLEPLMALAEDDPEARHGLLGAIGWAAPAPLRPKVQAWLDSQTGFERYLGVVACSLHRADPGRRLAAFLADPLPLLRARAARLAGELGRHDMTGRLDELAADETPEVRRAALWSLGLLGARGVLPALEALAEEGWRPAALLTPRLIGLDAGRGWLRQLNGMPGQERLVVEALGMLGDPQAIPWLLGKMGDPLLARLAGESFSLITGIDLAFDDLEGERPEDFVAGPTDDPADEDVAMDPDEDLPWPDAELCAAWWREHGGTLAPGVRHLLGRPLDEAVATSAFAKGFQRQRRAAAIELALMQPGTRLANWRAKAG